MAVALRNAIKHFPVVVPVVSDKPRHPYYSCATMCTGRGGATSNAADVFQFSPSLEKFRALPSNRPRSSSSKSATSIRDQTSFVFKVRHFRDSPSKRRNYLRSVTSRKTRIFNFTYRSRCKGKGLIVPLLDMKAYESMEVQPHTFVIKVRGRFSPGGKNPWYPLNGKLGGPQSSSGPLEEKSLLPLLGIEPRLVDCPSHR
jgi:hypothetical protein